LVFVLVRHAISGEGGLAISEEHDIVYRGASAPGEQPPPPRLAPADATWRREIVPTPVLLFRYSALSFNAHRIHFDQPYAVEHGYPGLVVHGPLLATLLMDLLRRNLPTAVKSFRFRALRPIFDTAPFAVCGRPGDGGKIALWAQDAHGHLCMDAEAGT
jgi:3-methylfumaryl-CoA hydratase